MFNEQFSLLDSMFLVGLQRDMRGRDFYAGWVDDEVFPDEWFDRMYDLHCIVEDYVHEQYDCMYSVSAYYPPADIPSGTAFEILVRV